MKFINRYFIGGHWSIAYNVTPSNNEVNIIKNKSKEWYADPFLFSKDDQTYLFGEIYDKKKEKGIIGYSILINNSFEPLSPVLERDYHISYPCVFSINNQIYMIPETSENRTLELYVAIDFPTKWNLQRVLLSDIVCYDTTYFEFENKHYLFVYQEMSNNFYIKVFLIQNDSFDLKLVSESKAIDKTQRPAGSFFYKDNVLYRPSQYEKIKYGERIIVNRVEFDNELYREIQVSGLDVGDYKILSTDKFVRTHTINFTDKVRVIDLRTEKLGFFIPIMRIMRKIKIKRRKK